MSIRLLSATIAELPFVLREQIIGYAESVKQALPAIFEAAGVKSTTALADEMTYLAGIRKLHGLVASNYWALDNSATLLQASDVSTIRMGAQDFSRGGQIHTALKNALEALEIVLSRHGLKNLLALPYTELAQRLVENGPQ